MSGILGNFSWQYQKPDGAIYDNVKDKVLEFWPAGYTQKFIRPVKGSPGIAEEVNRQEFFSQLYKEAETIETESSLFPFANYEYKINFYHDSNNRYDPFAVKIEFSTPEESYWNDYSIGFIPAKINQLILAERERISDKQILSVTNCLNDKFFCARIAIGYDGTVLNELTNKQLRRFAKL